MSLALGGSLVVLLFGALTQDRSMMAVGIGASVPFGAFVVALAIFGPLFSPKGQR
jgi:hypothetical protein